MTEIATSGIADSFALSGAQLDYTKIPGFRRHIIPLHYAVRGGIDREAFGASVADLATRHDALRLRLTRSADGWRQVVGNGPEITHHPDVTDLVAHAKSLHAEFLDLEASGVFRVATTQAIDGSDAVLLNVHHLATDSWSNRLIANELWELYDARLRRRVPDLVDLKTSFRDTADHSGVLTARQTKFWSDQLLQGMVLPIQPSHAHHPSELSKDFAEDVDGERLEAAARAMGISVVGIALAALSRACRSVFEVESPLVMVSYAGRRRPEQLNVVGLFAQTLPIALPTSTGRSIEMDARACFSAWLTAIQLSGGAFSLARVRDYMRREQIDQGQRLRRAVAPSIQFAYVDRRGSSPDADGSNSVESSRVLADGVVVSPLEQVVGYHPDTPSVIRGTKGAAISLVHDGDGLKITTTSDPTISSESVSLLAAKFSTVLGELAATTTG